MDRRLLFVMCKPNMCNYELFYVTKLIFSHKWVIIPCFRNIRKNLSYVNCNNKILNCVVCLRIQFCQSLPLGCVPNCALFLSSHHTSTAQLFHAYTLYPTAINNAAIGCNWPNTVANHSDTNSLKNLNRSSLPWCYCVCVNCIFVQRRLLEWS